MRVRQIANRREDQSAKTIEGDDGGGDDDDKEMCAYHRSLILAPDELQ
jgi:hypothetical protein